MDSSLSRKGRLQPIHNIQTTLKEVSYVFIRENLLDHSVLFYNEIKREAIRLAFTTKKCLNRPQVDTARHRHPIFSQVELLRPFKLLKVQLIITTEPKTTSVSYPLY